MYLHIGNGKNLKTEEIVGIFDLDTATVSKQSKKFISDNKRISGVEYDDSDLPRTFILTEKNKKERIILSRISSLGLSQRAAEGIGE